MAPSGGIGAVRRRRGCGKACVGGGGRWGDEGGMCVGGVGTVPVAGSVGACTCGRDRQWGRRGRRGRCDGRALGVGIEGCLGRGLRRRGGDGGWRRRRGRGRHSSRRWQAAPPARQRGPRGRVQPRAASLRGTQASCVRQREGEGARGRRRRGGCGQARLVRAAVILQL